MVGFADGSTYAMNPKDLSLVTAEEDPAADEPSEHLHVSKRAKHNMASAKGKEGAPDPKSSKKRAAPGAGASTSKAAKKKKTAASQVGCERSRTNCQHTQRGSRTLIW